MSRRKRHGLGDVDGALNGPLNGGEPDLVPCREFGGHDARVRDVSAVPVAEVGIGLGVGFVWCDVAHDDQERRIGAEVRLVVLHHVVARDVLQRGFGHDFAVGVECTVVGGSHDVAGDFSWRGGRVGQSRHRLLLHLVQFFLWEGGLENGVRHNAKEVACVLAQGACKKALGVGAERGSEKLHILGDLRLGAGLGARRHHGADDAGQSCLVAFQKRRVVQGHVPGHSWHAVVFDNDDLQAVVELELGGGANLQLRRWPSFRGLAAVQLAPRRRTHGTGQDKQARVAKKGVGIQNHGCELGSCKK